MSRSFGASMLHFAREVERVNRARVRQQQAQVQANLRSAREVERTAKAYARSEAMDLKERRRLYLESRAAQVELQNEALEEEIQSLSGILKSGLSPEQRFRFSQLKQRAIFPSLDLGGLAIPIPRPRAPDLPVLSKLWGWLPWIRRKHDLIVRELKERHEFALEVFLEADADRASGIVQKTENHKKEVARIKSDLDLKNAEIDAFESSYQAGNREAVESFTGLILANSSLPECFPRVASTCFVAESKQIVVEYDLPSMEDSIPLVKVYKYIKATDEITESPRPEAQRRALYTSVCAQAVLRCMNDIFCSDVAAVIESMVINAHVAAIDRGTGRKIHPCIITVRITRDTFKSLEIDQVEAISCLKALNAGVSKSPSELAPVRPILELKMVDSRFVEEDDVLSTLDMRPNLMDLTPGEFESLITNLFQSMGLETKLTQASRDGGVDCVAYDPRPIFGGKVIIQAKRYKNTVGVSAVRDLFGTMQNEGASKGILVTTSGYGKAAFDFVANKPMELLSGSNLLYLLKEHANVEAKILMPDDWKDAELN